MKKKSIKKWEFSRKKGEEISIPKFGEGEKISNFGQNIHPWKFILIPCIMQALKTKIAVRLISKRVLK